MGLGDFLFGKMKLLPGVQSDIDRYSSLYGNVGDWGQGVGLGMAGHQAKSILKGMAQGDFDSNPLISGYFNPIRNQIETGKRDLIRRASMGVNRIAPGQQAGLLNAQTELAQNRADESGAMAMQAMVPQLYNAASNQYAAARGQRIGAEESAHSLQAQLADQINRARLSGMYKGQGFFDVANKVAGLAGAIGGAALGIPKLGGGGGYNSTWSPSNPGICWVAGELYGDGSAEQAMIRQYLLASRKPWIKAFIAIYRRFGQWWSRMICSHQKLRGLTLRLFNYLLEEARCAGY